MTGGDAFRPRVLLVAEMCNPDWVSVPLVGWSHSQALRRLADVQLVTQSYNRENLVSAGLVEGKDFTAIEAGGLDRAAGWLFRILRRGQAIDWTIATALGSLAYYGFEERVWRLFGPMITRGEFDVVHRLTPVSPATPSPIARHCRRVGVPFVLGPLNGGVPWPPGHREARRGEGEWLASLRGLHRMLPGYRATRASASAIIVGSRGALAEMPARFVDRCVYIPENGFDPTRFDRRIEAGASRPIRVASVGRHVRLKGIDLLIEAAAPLVRAGAARLDIIGEGPETPRLQAMAAAEGISERVSFPGWVNHVQLQDRLVQSDVLGFPSLREFGGGVVVEAMALGLVPVVLDWGGPGEIVSPATGFAVSMGTRPEVVDGLRRVLGHLAAEPALIRPIGERARQRVLSLFTWDAKARQVLEVYSWVAGRAARRPNFGIPFPD